MCNVSSNTANLSECLSEDGEFYIHSVEKKTTIRFLLFSFQGTVTSIRRTCNFYFIYIVVDFSVKAKLCLLSL